MGVKIRKREGKWYLFVNHRGRRKAKCVGTSRETAEQIRRQIEAHLALGDAGFLQEKAAPTPTFNAYAERWLEEYAEIECKPSTVAGYRQILKSRLIPQFGIYALDRISREQLKQFFAKLANAGLSRNTLRNTLCTIRVILNQAVEDDLIVKNPAARMGRFTKSEQPKFQATALTREESNRFLQAAQTVCPEYYVLFLTALRAGLRRGEVIALQWGDIQFGASESDPNRYILVQHNYVNRQFTTPKSKKNRRVDLSRQLRRSLLELRDQKLLKAFSEGKAAIADILVFPSPHGAVLDPDNLIKRYFLPAIEHAGLRRFRFHDLRHTYGSLLIQEGASITYVKEQMGHSSIQVTVDTYGHLIPGADIAWVDRLDSETTPRQNATPAQLEEMVSDPEITQVIEEFGGGGWTRTNDLRIMRPSL